MAAELHLTRDRVKWWRVNKTFLPLKLLYFFSLAAIGTLLPFITIYMKQLGLTSSETGIIYGVMPFVGFFFRPIFGAIADKFSKHKLVLIIMCVLSGVSHVCLLLVPANPEQTETNIFTSIHCNTQDSYISDCNHGYAGNSCPMSFTNYTNLTLTRIQNNNTVKDQKLTCSASCHFALPGAYSTRVCFTSSVGEFPANCLNIWISSEDDPHVDFNLLDVNSVIEKEIIKDRHNLKNTPCKDYRDYDLKNVSYNGEKFWRLVCDSETILNCDLACKKVPNDGCDVEQEPYGKIFWLFFLIFLLGNIVLAPVLSLIDSIVYDTLGEQTGSWGKQRLWGTVGFASFAITSTIIMDALSKSYQSIDYNISFYLFGVHMLICAVVCAFLHVSDNLVCGQMLHDVGKLLRQPQIVLFLLMVLICGLYTGVIEAFLFWYLRDLQQQHEGHMNSNAVMMGLCLLLNCLFEAPFLFLSGSIMKRIGQVNCMYLAFLGYTIRFLGYSLLSNPWYVLFLEPFHGLTFGLLWAAASSYAYKISPPGLSATTQCLMGGVHFGFGKGIGSLLTGFFFSSLGAQWSFRVYGISGIVFLLLYFILNCTCFKDRESVDTGVVKVPNLDIKSQDIGAESEAAAGDRLLGNNIGEHEEDIDEKISLKNISTTPVIT